MNNTFHKYVDCKTKYYQMAGNGYYYHGSSHLIKDYLTPHPSKVVDGDDVVFATNTLWLALVFIAHSTDADIEIGFIDGHPYIMEQYPDASNKFLNGGGYIYYVEADRFKPDERVGMKQHEFITYDKVPIVKTKKIKNIMKELKKTEVNIITFDDKEKMIYDFIKK